MFILTMVTIITVVSGFFYLVKVFLDGVDAKENVKRLEKRVEEEKAKRDKEKVDKMKLSLI